MSASQKWTALSFKDRNLYLCRFDDWIVDTSITHAKINYKGGILNIKNEFNPVYLIVPVICVVLSFALGFGFSSIICRISGWQAVSYAIVGGILVALLGIILYRILALILGE